MSQHSKMDRMDRLLRGYRKEENNYLAEIKDLREKLKGAESKAVAAASVVNRYKEEQVEIQRLQQSAEHQAHVNAHLRQEYSQEAEVWAQMFKSE